MKWRCTICGYIHEGDEPPEICPVCGVDASYFEKVEDAAKAAAPDAQAKAVSWQCLVCNYIHVGEAPPDTCPVCGADASQFVRVPEPADATGTAKKELSAADAIKGAVRTLSYGLFIITAQAGGVDNGQTANTCFQITSEPTQIAIGINKNNYTHELIEASQKFGVGILDQNGHDLARRFGYRSGREFAKFDGIKAHRGATGVLLPDEVLATMEAEVVGQMDAGTHTLFLAKIVAAEVLSSAEPMTYAYFRSKK